MIMVMMMMVFIVSDTSLGLVAVEVWSLNDGDFSHSCLFSSWRLKCNKTLLIKLIIKLNISIIIGRVHFCFINTLESWSPIAKFYVKFN